MIHFILYEPKAIIVHHSSNENDALRFPDMIEFQSFYENIKIYMVTVPEHPQNWEQHIRGFILLRMQKLYSPVSKINARILFVKYGNDVSCFPPRAEYSTSGGLNSARLEVQDSELKLTDSTNSWDCLLEQLEGSVIDAPQMEEPILKTLIIKSWFPFRLQHFFLQIFPQDDNLSVWYFAIRNEAWTCDFVLIFVWNELTSLTSLLITLHHTGSYLQG